MLELLLCSLLTVFPDYLYRRYVQGKRLGKEITFYSVWFELRWGITSCLILTVSLITVIFYNHPSTNNVTLLYRTVPFLPEINGRVAEVYVGLTDEISKGAPIFRLDSSKQEPAVESSRRKIAEIDAEALVAQSEIVKTEGQILEAKAPTSRPWTNSRPSENFNDATQGTSHSAKSRNSGQSGGSEGCHCRRYRCKTAGRGADCHSSTGSEGQCRGSTGAGRSRSAQDRRPCRRRGCVEQFALRPGDMVNPMMRPAGIFLIPAGAGQLYAGFGQIEAQVMKIGMIAEGDWRIQTLDRHPDGGPPRAGLIAAGQFRRRRAIARSATGHTPGTLLVATRAA